ncbi:general substrate transporter [Pisolithus orientalis]|uniref:general substrate transporter n=1 Tax=Pisolithus orientalis TaxID=936130 RepID=UPI002225500A|nr:general substrate transporter [Pisolithus orientalis]KAI6015215.1 general substrate transporter [Pisolithus orientalis]
MSIISMQVSSRGLHVGWVTIMLALLASMGGFIFGDDCAFSDVREGLIVSLLSIGTLVGALMGAPIADWLGRRYAMTTECGIFIIGVIVQITSTHVWQQFAVGRFISGLGVGALSAAVPMVCCPSRVREVLSTLTISTLFITFGILVAYCISIGARSIAQSGSWRTVVGIGILWALILGIGILFMPETHGRMEEAQVSLAVTRGIPASEADKHNFLRREAEGIKQNVEYEKHTKGGWVDCFKPKDKILYRTLLGMSLQSLQQLTGANYFFYYGATVFLSVGLSDPYVTQIILGTVNFVCTFGGMYVMERVRHRPLASASPLFESLTFSSDDDGPSSVEACGNLHGFMIVAACLFILGYAMTWAPGVWILIGETFPTRTRAKQASLSTAGNWMWNFLIAFFTPFIGSAIGFKYGYVFASCNLLGAVVVYFFLYESSDLTLEEVNMMYTDPTCKPWTSRQWAPSGYSSRRDLIEKDRSDESNNIEDAQVQNITGRSCLKILCTG